MNRLKTLFIALTVVFTGQLAAQNIPPASMSDVDFSLVSWERGEVLVRFADQLIPSLNADKSETKINPVDQILADYQGVKLEQLFPVQKPIPGGAKGFTTYMGVYYEYPKLTNIYKVSIKDTSYGSIFPLITAFENLGKEYVLYAEPNYLHQSTSTPPLTNDSLLSQQWAFGATKSDSIRREFQANSKSDSAIVIAILDSGVDTLHLDLRNKIHKTSYEINGLPGVDDDGNGFVDDFWGWDFVNGDNQPLDNLGHGTHCASIAAAENNNSVGIAGIAQDAKIRSYQVLESNNGGTSSNIAQAVSLAAMSGSDIISMSLGGYGRSLVLENALQYAYGFSFLVASAGNDGICIRADGQMCPDGAFPSPSYPAAYSFVLGVQATKSWNYMGYRVGWSNYDFTGPYWSDYPDKFNYEVNAPGYGIFGALASGNSGKYDRYRSWNGTSMAAPVVAGMISLYKTSFPSAPNEEIFVKFINSWYYPDSVYSKYDGYPYNHVDLVEAYYGDQPATPFMVNFDLVDTLQGNSDGNPDGGEIISLFGNIKNVGGHADSVWAKISVGDFEDSTLIDVLNDSVFLGQLSEFGVINNSFNPWTFQIDSNIANYRNLRLKLEFNTSDNKVTSQEFNIRVTNGRKFNAGLYSGTTILYPTDLNIIDGNVVFDTLIIKPGAIVRFAPAKSLSFNHIQCEGTKDSIITFTKYGNAYGKWGFIRSNLNNYIPEFKYCRFEYAKPFGSYAALIKTPDSWSGGGFIMEDCIVENCEDTDFGLFWQLNDSSKVIRSVFINNNPSRAVISNVKGELIDNIFVDNLTGGCPTYGGSNHGAIELGGIDQYVSPTSVLHYDNIRGNSFFGNRQLCDWNGSQYKYQVVAHEYSGQNIFMTTSLGPNFYGFSNADSIESCVLDNGEFPFFGVVEASDSSMTQPSQNAHGHVWKVEIDSFSTSYNDVSPPFINGGSHTIKVYFNRAMDVSRNPLVRYGTVFPFNSYTLLDSTYWSSDSMVFYSRFDLDPTTVINGTMGLSVTDYLDNEGFSGPRETDRFKFNISTYGALSFGFNAIGDTSSIRLDWRTPQGEATIIGYDLFRYDTISSVIDTIKLNSTPLIDTNYVDNNVLGGIEYFYFFKAIKTSLDYTDASGIASAMTLTSRPSIKDLQLDVATTNSAQISAKISAKDLSSWYSWELIDPTGSSINTTQQSLPLNDMSYQNVSRNFNGLQQNQEYKILLKAENGDGKTNSDTLIFRTLEIPSLTFNYDSTLCAGDVLGITNQSTISTGTLSYVWQIRNSSGSLVHTSTDVNPTFTMTTAGTYTIKLTASSLDAVTTTKTTGLVVEALPSPVITPNGSTLLCQGQSLTLNTTAGYQSYSWNNGAATSSILVTDSNTYTLTVTSSNGCIGSTSLNVDVNPLPTAIVSSATGDFDFCDGSSLSLDAPTGASGYQWYKDGKALAGATSATLSATSGGSYAVQVTSSDGCSSLSSAQAVTKNALPTASISNGSALSFCDGGSVTLSAPANMTYSWSTGATTQSINQSGSGQVGLTVTDNNGCSSVALPVTVNVYSVPSMTVSAASSTSICQGQSVTLQASGGFSSYAWSNGATNQNLIATTAGNYTVTGTTADGCTASSVAQSVVVNPNPVATVTNSGSSILCSGDNTTLSAPSGMSSYLWSDGSTSQSLTVATAGNYSVTVTNADGCSATSTIHSISTSQITAPMIVTSGALEFCQGESVTLGVPQGYAGYSWNTGAGFSQLVANQSGSYFATVSNIDGCAVNSDTVTVTVFATPVTPNIAYSANDTVMVSNVASGNQWYFNGNLMQGETNDTLRPLNLGNYSVRVIDTNGCEGDMSAMQFYNSIGFEEALANQIRLFPNPTSGAVTLELGAVKVASVRIYDARGRLLESLSSCPSNCRLELGNFENGMYQLVVLTEDGVTITKPVVLQK